MKKPSRKKITTLAIISLLAVTSVLCVMTYGVWIQLNSGKKFQVELKNLYGLKRGSPFLEWPSTDKLGRVYNIERFNGHIYATIELDCDEETAKRVLKENNDFYVQRFGTEEHFFKLYGTQRLLTGPALVMRFGPEKVDLTVPAPVVHNRMPPREGITWDSPKISVVFERDVHQLKTGSIVLNDRGIPIGEVDEVTFQENGTVKVEASLIKNDLTPYYINKNTRYFVDTGELTSSGLKGSPETLILGPRLVASIDLGKFKLGEEQLVFDGVNTPKPVSLSRVGEKVLYLETSSEVPEDTAISYFGLQDQNIRIGYVKSSQVSLDSGTKYLEVRIYPEYLHFVKDESQFAISQPLKFKAYDEPITGISDALTKLKPDLVLKPKSLFVPLIELYTPNTAKKVYSFEQNEDLKIKQAFYLHPKPEEEWLKWRMMSTQVNPAETFPYPQIVKTRLAWADPKSFQGDIIERNAYAMVVSGGILGSQRALQITQEVKQAKKNEFSINGQTQTLMSDHFPVGDVKFLYKRICQIPKATLWPKDQIITLNDAADVYIVPLNSEPKFMDARKLQKIKGGFRIKPETITLDKNWDGLPVMERSSKKLIGILLVRDDKENPYIISDIPSDL